MLFAGVLVSVVKGLPDVDKLVVVVPLNLTEKSFQ